MTQFYYSNHQLIGLAMLLSFAWTSISVARYHSSLTEAINGSEVVVDHRALAVVEGRGGKAAAGKHLSVSSALPQSDINPSRTSENIVTSASTITQALNVPSASTNQEHRMISSDPPGSSKAKSISVQPPTNLINNQQKLLKTKNDKPPQKVSPPPPRPKQLQQQQQQQQKQQQQQQQQKKQGDDEPREKAGRSIAADDYFRERQQFILGDADLAKTLQDFDIYDQSLSPQDNLWRTSTLLPDWLKQYFQWHKEQRSKMNETNWNNGEQFRFLIPVAHKGQKSGGMTDRLRPLPILLRLAAQTNRILLIRWNRPFHLEEFLLPPRGGLDWRVPSYMVETVETTGPHIPWELMQKDAASTTTKPLMTTKFQSWHYGENYYNDQIQQQQQESNELPATTIFRDVWKVMFTPSPPVARRIVANYQKLHLIPGEFAMAHIRAFYGRSDRSQGKIDYMATNALNCVSQLRPGGPYFVASDSFRAIQTAIQYGQSHNVTVVAAHHPRQPLHVDFLPEDNNNNNNNKLNSQNSNSSTSSSSTGTATTTMTTTTTTTTTPADYYDGFVDMYLMAGTRCAAVGPGGFARWGHLLGYNETCSIHHAGRKLQTCEWKSKLLEGETLPGYPVGSSSSELKKKEAEVDDSSSTSSSSGSMSKIPKYYEPMPAYDM